MSNRHDIIKGLENIKSRMHGTHLSKDQLIVADAISLIEDYEKKWDDIIVQIATSPDFLNIWIPTKWKPYPDCIEGEKIVYEVSVIDADGELKRECACYTELCGWRKALNDKPLDVVAWKIPSEPYHELNRDSLLPISVQKKKIIESEA